MTVSAPGQLYREYVADGGATERSIGFPLQRTADLVVAANGVPQVLGEDYAVTGTSPNQKIVPLAPFWPNGTTIGYWRHTVRAQEYDIPPGVDLRNQSLEDELDRNQLQQQEQDAELTRAVKAPRGEIGLAMPARADLEGKLLAVLDEMIVGVPGDPVEIQALVDEAEEAAVLATAERVAAQTARTGSETARSGSEAARDASIVARQGSESARDLALAYGSADIYATWAALAAATGMAAGDVAQVVSSDTGTHTDPVVGGTVNNSGVFQYSASPAGWQRIADLESDVAEGFAITAAANASIYDRVIIGQRNLFDKTRVTAGKGLNTTTGAETTSSGNNVSHLIPVVGGEWYSMGLTASSANSLATIWLEDDAATFISGIASGVAGPFQAPANAAFAKVVVPNASLGTASFERGKLRSPYQDFDPTLVDNFNYRLIPDNALAALVAKKNMVDPSRMVADFFTNTGANSFLFSSNAGFNLLLPVPCKGNTAYYSNKQHYWCCYDAQGGKLNSGTNVVAGTFTTHADAVSISSSVSDANLSGWQLEEGTTGTAFEDFQLVLNPDLLPDLAPYLPAAEEPPSPYYGRDLLRQCHARLDFLENRSRVAVVQKFAIGFVGDSYINGVGYFISLLADYLQDKYGFGGQGFTSAGWFASGAGTYVDGGAQPSSMAGSVYGPTGINAIADPVIHGNWTNTPRAGANNTPDIGKIVSTTTGNYVRFTYLAGHDTAKAFFDDNGAGTGVIRYRWNSGSWSSNVTLGSGVTVETLTGMPSTAGTLTIEVVSGSVGISGVSFTQETTSGVVLHKLAASGSNSQQWAAMTPATWGAVVAGGLGLHAMIVMLGTNDGMLATPTTPSALAANVATILNAGLLSRPGMDCLAVAPMETPSSSNTQSAASYATALRDTCVSEMFAFMDLQPLVQKGTYLGAAVDTTTYDDANAEFPAMSTDDIHPSVTTLLGGAAMRAGFRWMMEP